MSTRSHRVHRDYAVKRTFMRPVQTDRLLKSLIGNLVVGTRRPSALHFRAGLSDASDKMDEFTGKSTLVSHGVETGDRRRP